LKNGVVALIAVGALAAGFLVGRLSVPADKTPAAVPIDTQVKVIRVSDGDTIEVASLRHPEAKDKVRLLGIDAPEPAEKGAKEATNALTELLKDREIHLEFDEPGVVQRDKSNRVLGYVLLNDSNLNIELVRRGLAKVSSKHGGARFSEELRNAEEEARAAKIGVWQAK
jgi:micrococcal nuclease